MKIYVKKFFVFDEKNLLTSTIYCGKLASVSGAEMVDVRLLQRTVKFVPQPKPVASTWKTTTICQARIQVVFR